MDVAGLPWAKIITGIGMVLSTGAVVVLLMGLRFWAPGRLKDGAEPPPDFGAMTLGGPPPEKYDKEKRQEMWLGVAALVGGVLQLVGLMIG